MPTERMSNEAYRAMMRGGDPQANIHQIAKRNKFNATPTESGGIRFDSKLEAARWEVLCLLRDAGRLKNLERQVRYTLLNACRVQGKVIRAIEYVADFVYEVDGRRVVEDTKGLMLPVAKIKHKLFAARYGQCVYIVDNANAELG